MPLRNALLSGARGRGGQVIAGNKDNSGAWRIDAADLRDALSVAHARQFNTVQSGGLLQYGQGAFAAQSPRRRHLGDHGALAAERPWNGWLENKMTAVSQAAEDQLAGMAKRADAPSQTQASAIERRAGAGLIGKGSTHAHEKA
ncbi:MAG: hypothetical protein HIU89_05285 [Proteobacteria bacterium]|nr:hypothetical protein [Pseudomonadota bacterium]